MTPKDFFDKQFASKVQENPACMREAGVTSKKIALEIEGSTGGQWTFEFDASGLVAMKSGVLAPDAACVISMKDDTFTGMLTGKVNVPMAFVMRKIKVKGESALAAKLGLTLQKVFK
jgi:putative sterol carrier protein